MRGNRRRSGKPRRCSPMTSSTSSWTRERNDRLRQPRPVTLSAYGLQQGAVNRVFAPECGFRNLRQRPPPRQCHRPINFGLCRTGLHSFVEANLSGRKPWFIPLVSFEREWGYSCPRVGSSLRSELSHLRLDHGKSPWLRCLTQSPPSWSLMMTLTFEPQLGG